jgi:ribosome-binding protein aMBF1 (putative translation factor)
LSADDREDLFELVRELPRAKSRDDLESIFLAMEEILAQKTAESRPMDLEVEPGRKLRRWIEFISQRVRAAREDADLTQAELSLRSGLPQSHISRIENGKLSPSRFTIEKIAKGLDKEVSYFDPSA